MPVPNINPAPQPHQPPSHPLPKNNAPANNSSIFEGKESLSRRELKYELKQPKAETLKLQRQSGLSLTRDQRGKLIEKYFPKSYGSDISKQELNKQIEILKRKPMENALERKQTLKELDFLKKLGEEK